ncbi:MAG TPA: glutamate mutase L [Solirubrobacterales bacterium]|nr:glutamate mutase L [Solirubrobacterales bacterium]
MHAVALCDFGSTYTKLRLVDPVEGWLLARAEEPTTIGTDLMDGYGAALASAEAEAGEPVEVEEELAASSAGGGLRVAAVGLVADLTAAAARQAALNAGARVGTVLAGALEEEQLDALREARPEIVLFAGGTDGGQSELVLENARRLAAERIEAYFVVACNSEVADEAAELLRSGGARADVAANVMPRLGEIEVEPAREVILHVFLEHVIGGKGLSASAQFARMVKMPTPEAVLEATRLLSRGTDGIAGLGDVMVIDVGGATTDVHSTRVVEAAAPGIEDPLLPPPPTLRTVEGDLGLRSGAPGVLAADARWIGEAGDIDAAAVGRGVALRSEDARWIADTPQAAELDRLLATGCAAHALRRHCGTMLLGRSDGGPPTLLRDGPDLREVGRVFGTGGVFAHRSDGTEILEAALERRAPRSLAPRDPLVEVDGSYILAAAGLLAAHDPDAAIRLIRRELAGVVRETT